MQTYRCEGIILHTLNFGDYDQIVTVFSFEIGLLKFIVKKGNSTKHGLKNTPLTKAEFVYTQGKSELFKLKELSGLNHYLTLRKNLRHLDTACECLRAIRASQMLHKPAPDLYGLLEAYLDRIPLIHNLPNLESSFKLKILRHEGILDMEEGFNHRDIPHIEQLAYAQSYGVLNTMIVEDRLHAEIKAFFTKTIAL